MFRMDRIAGAKIFCSDQSDKRGLLHRAAQLEALPESWRDYF
jgi:hypothetical protein